MTVGQGRGLVNQWLLSIRKGGAASWEHETRHMSGCLMSFDVACQKL